MNKPLAAFGAVAGLISAIFLTVGMPSFGRFNADNHWSFDGCASNPTSPSETRELPWSGSSKVEIRVPATVHFTNSATWHATAQGPASLLDLLRFDNGRLEFDRSSVNLCGRDLKIELSGPGVREWSLAGSGDLSLEQLDQPDLNLIVAGSGSASANGKVERTQASVKGSGDIDLNRLQQSALELDIRGSGSATASGQAERVRISIAGSGDARLGKLNVKDAEVSIKGSGNVDIAPDGTADVEIYGSGDVHLLKRPKSLQSQVHGSGNIYGG